MNESEFAASQLSDGVISNNLAAQSSYTYKTGKSKKSNKSKKNKANTLAVIPEHPVSRKNTFKAEERIPTKVSKDESINMDDDFSDSN